MDNGPQPVAKEGRGSPLLEWWPAFVRYVPTLTILVAGLWTVITWTLQYRENAVAEANRLQVELAKAEQAAKSALTIAQRDSQKPFLEKQLQFYFEAVRVTAKLATVPPAAVDDRGPGSVETFEWAHRRFWELYWGELVAVESPDVAGTMVNFGARLKEVVTICAEGDQQRCWAEQQTLTSLSLKVAQEVRKSIQSGWGYSLPELRSKS